MGKRFLKIFLNYLPTTVFSLVSIVPLLACPWVNGTASVLITFYVNAVIFIVGITFAQKNYPISIDMMVWTFLYFFMFFAPTVQYLYGVYPWSGNLTDTECLLANILISVFSASYILGKFLGQKIRVKRSPFAKKREPFITSKFVFGETARYLLIYACVGLAIYSLFQTGFTKIIVSRDDAVAAFYKGSNSAIALIVDISIPAFLAYCACEAAQHFRKGKKELITFIILTVCLLVSCFPTSIPRYKAAAIYLTLGILICPWVQKHNLFFWAFVIALFFAFPILSSFRHELDITLFNKIFSGQFLVAYTKGDYDAYRMFVSSIRYIEANGLVYGRQLAGVLLFFVPSAIWPNKPGGSGSFLIETELGPDAFSNVSCPLVAEGMLNFGIIGVILFAIILGFLSEKCDSLYWLDADEKRKFSPYLFLMFLFFFLLRGDLLSSYAYAFGFMFIGYVLKVLRPVGGYKKERYEYLEE